jgi:hypothetical protein
VTVGSHIFYRWRGDWGDPKSFRRPYSGVELAQRPESAPLEAPALPVRTESGVRIHHGEPAAYAQAETVSGVRIHRSTGPAEVKVHSGSPEEAPAQVPAADVTRQASAPAS